MGFNILSSGSCLPTKSVANDELEKILTLGSGYIKNVTGISSRRYCDPEKGENLISLARRAARTAMINARINKIGCVLVVRDLLTSISRGVSIGREVLTALQEIEINIDDAYAPELGNYCLGAHYACQFATGLLSQKPDMEPILVVAATDTIDLVNLSPALKVRRFSLPDEVCFFQEPRRNAFLWGSGAGAIVIGRSSNPNESIRGYHTLANNALRHHAFGFGEDTEGRGFMAMDGRGIYKFVLEYAPDFIISFLKRHCLSLSDVDWIVPHQPQPRMLSVLAERLGLPPNKMIICDDTGNLMGASVLVAYDLARKEGKIKTGDRVLMLSFGDSDLTIGAMLFTQC